MKKCQECNEGLDYSEDWDAYFCPKCNEWLEEGCGDPTCFFACCQRPIKPLIAKNDYNPL